METTVTVIIRIVVGSGIGICGVERHEVMRQTNECQ